VLPGSAMMAVAGSPGAPGPKTYVVARVRSPSITVYDRVVLAEYVTRALEPGGTATIWVAGSPGLPGGRV
jgi:hypothetical protein